MGGACFKDPPPTARVRPEDDAADAGQRQEPPSETLKKSIDTAVATGSTSNRYPQTSANPVLLVENDSPNNIMKSPLKGTTTNNYTTTSDEGDRGRRPGSQQEQQNHSTSASSNIKDVACGTANQQQPPTTSPIAATNTCPSTDVSSGAGANQVVQGRAPPSDTSKEVEVVTGKGREDRSSVGRNNCAAEQEAHENSTKINHNIGEGDLPRESGGGPAREDTRGGSHEKSQEGEDARDEPVKFVCSIAAVEAVIAYDMTPGQGMKELNIVPDEESESSSSDNDGLLQSWREDDDEDEEDSDEGEEEERVEQRREDADNSEEKETTNTTDERELRDLARDVLTNTIYKNVFGKMG